MKQTNKKVKFYLKKFKKGFSDGLSHSTSQKSKETRGNAITQPQSYIPSQKIYTVYAWNGTEAGYGVDMPSLKFSREYINKVCIPPKVDLAIPTPCI